MIKQIVGVFTIFILSYGSVQALTFKIATLSTDGSVWMEKMRASAKEINEKTDKRVNFKFYPGGVMGGDKNVLRKIKFGQLHGAAMPNSGVAGVYPDIQLYNLIVKFQTLSEIDYVREKMDAQLLVGLEEKGLVAFGFSEIGLAYTMSTQPVHNITDLQQQKSWAPDSNKIAIQAYKALSISPIPLPLRDVLVGLQTGMINSVAGTPTGAIALQWHTKIKYVTDFPLSYIFGVFFLNKKDFNKISDKDQQVVRTVMAKAIKAVDRQSRKDNVNAVLALKKVGVEFLAVEDAVASKLKGMMELANQDIISKSGLSMRLVELLDQHLAIFRSKDEKINIRGSN
ncbi:MAG: TRAP transporter substrate-binding protein DctP [Methylococcales symbiont of Iophon sp. n. MRB-2018]|nr:MAG: TRAP transporter substrate-binding protein DctP [Methylococcales symbiont of Iophon sp. n. MRB-2018]